MITQKAAMAQTAFWNPYDTVMPAPMASQARKAIGPRAVLPTRKEDFRARFAVKRRAKSSSV